MLAGRHLIQYGTKRKQIAPHVEFLAARRLGRHESNRANRHARRSQVLGSQGRACLRRLFDRAAVRHQLGQSKLQDFRLPARRNEDVSRFDIAVKHAFRMCCIQRVRDLNAHLEQFLQVRAMPREVAVQRLAFNQLHGDEVFVIRFANFVDGANVGMIQRRSRARFLLEPLQRLLVLGQIRRQKLQGHAPAEVEIFRNPNGSRAARTKALKYLIVRNLADRITSQSLRPWSAADSNVNRRRILPATLC